MTLAGLEPAIFGSEDQRLIHEATGPAAVHDGVLSNVSACSCKRESESSLSVWGSRIAMYKNDSPWQLDVYCAMRTAQEAPTGD